MEWRYSTNPKDPCPLCVQWRPIEPDPKAELGPHEPYSSDGNIVPLVYESVHAYCAEAALNV